jgi:phospholipid/cholesterol/gamma-HCH transport system substrate-binding protein
MIVRRVIPAVVGALILAAIVFVVVSNHKQPPTYKIVFDNAFGLTTGAEMRVAGVKVGKVTKLDIQRKTARAVVTTEIERTDFGRLHSDATCRVEPQSLIGEYFINCDPGTAPKIMPSGASLPVSHTSGTIPPDLVLDVMQLPQRQRLGIILTELGAGLGARGPALNATIRRAIPALQETDKVLNLLAGERRTLRGLAHDADTVLTRVASNSDGVARFVSTARDTAQASADRRRALSGTIQRLPRFLREARPVLRDLGTAAREQTPALRDLRVSAPSLTTMLQRLGSFTSASEPAITALGQASVSGRAAVKAARPTIAALRSVAGAAPEPAANLRIIGQHLDDRSFAVEPNKASPGGKGFTGLEALLQYPFLQSQAVNLYDKRGYMLKLNVLVNECTRYTNADGVRRDPARAKRCSAALGNGAPPLPAATRTRSHKKTRTRHHRAASKPGTSSTPNAPSAPSAPGTPSTPATPSLPSVPSLPQVPPLPTPTVPQLPSAPKTPQAPPVNTLLDYLLGT